jgi:demethylmenaquinone methyltransferase/2-methoxy-6-polyprenyl-1,4-benzoquinol methylase
MCVIGTRRALARVVTGWQLFAMNTDVDTEASEAAASTGAARREYVRSVFTQIAPRYDLLNHLLSFNIDRRWRRKAIAALEWRREPAGTYLDLCAGTQDVAAELARQQGFQGRVIAADFAEPMLRAGRHKVGKTDVSAVVADALELPLPDASASGAIISFGIRNVADVEAAMREAARVLKPGGRFIVLEFSTPRNRLGRVLYHSYFHVILPRLATWISGHPTAYHYLPKSVANFPTEDDLALQLRQNGFGRVSWSSLMFGIAAIHVAER